MANIINSKAAGIDISSKEHFVCIPAVKAKDDGEVRTFGTYTEDLHEIAKWLKENKITTVAMESTGVYWTELFSVLQDYGFEVLLVNAHHIKNVPGRKTDVKDAQWIQKLHSYGFLNGSFQPDNQLRTLRTFVRRRTEIVRDMARATNRLIKSLEQMNIKTSQVITDIHGKTGTAVIRAILSGERKAKNFLTFKDGRIKSSDEDFVKALEGNWKEEQLYCLQLAQETYDFLKGQLRGIDGKIEQILEIIQKSTGIEKVELEPIKHKPKNSPMFNAKEQLKNILGVDVTKIYGLKEGSGLVILSETGYNLEQKFPTEKKFLSWLNLVPDKKVSGGKVLSKKMKKKKNAAGQAFRAGAATLWRSKNPIGDQLRLKKSRNGAGPAIVSTARRIAIIYYNMVVNQEEFDPSRFKTENEKALLNRLNFFERKAEEMRREYEKKVA